MTNHLAAFQVQESLNHENNQVLISQEPYHKEKCSFCSRLGHRVDKCYKKRGYPSGMFKGKKPSVMASTNMALTRSVNTNEKVSCEQISKD